MAKKPFHAGPVIRRYAAACADPDVDASPEARRAAAGVSSEQVARWRKRNGFAEWLGEEVKRRLAARTWEVWAVVFRAARDGNLTAAKLLTDRLASEVQADEESPRTFVELARLARLEEADDTGGDLS